MIKGTPGAGGGGAKKVKQKASGQDTVTRTVGLQTQSDYLVLLREALRTPSGEDRNVLEDFKALCTFKCKDEENPLCAEIKFETPKLKPRVRTHLLNMSRDALKECYDANGYGWNDREFESNLHDREARFFMVYEKETEKLIGFAHIRFTLTGDFVGAMEGEPVVLINDLILEPSARRKGLGTRLLQLIELVARKYNMHYVGVALVKGTPGAVDFFTKGKVRGFRLDAEYGEDEQQAIYTKLLPAGEATVRAKAEMARAMLAEMEARDAAAAKAKAEKAEKKAQQENSTPNTAKKESASASASAALRNGTEPTRQCSACLESKPKSAYSKAQYKPGGRCAECIKANVSSSASKPKKEAVAKAVEPLDEQWRKALGSALVDAKVLRVEGAPLPCEGHCASAVGSKMYVFGGALEVEAPVAEETIPFGGTDGVEVIQDALGDGAQEAIDENTVAPLVQSDELFAFDATASTWSKVSVGGDRPMARTGASMISVGDKLYVFGGFNGECGWLNDLHEFDTTTGKWRRVDAKGAPSPRDKAMMCADDRTGVIYLFGGFGPNTSDSVQRDQWGQAIDATEAAVEYAWCGHTLYSLDTTASDAVWLAHKLSGAVPSPRCAASMCRLGDRLFVFGGKDEKKRQNSVFTFALPATKEALKEKEEVAAAASDAISAWGNIPSLLKDDKKTESTEVTQVDDSKGVSIVSSVFAVSDGVAAPAPRSFHCAAPIANSLLIVLGGLDEDDKHCSVRTLWTLDAKSGAWSSSEVRVADSDTDALKARGFATLVPIDSRQLLLFGGSTAYDTPQRKSSQYVNDLVSYSV